MASWIMDKVETILRRNEIVYGLKQVCKCIQTQKGILWSWRSEGKPKRGRLTSKPATSTTPCEGFLHTAIPHPAPLPLTTPQFLGLFKQQYLYYLWISLCRRTEADFATKPQTLNTTTKIQQDDIVMQSTCTKTTFHTPYWTLVLAVLPAVPSTRTAHPSKPPRAAAQLGHFPQPTAASPLQTTLLYCLSFRIPHQRGRVQLSPVRC